MLIEALAAAVLAQPECMMSDGEALRLVAVASNAEKRHGLPAGLLVAVALAESGGKRRLVSRHRKGCDAGAGQVHVPGCHSGRLERLLQLSVNLDASASVLAKSRARCARSPRLRFCKISPWAGYNAGSPRWWPRVYSIWRRLMTAPTVNS